MSDESAVREGERWFLTVDQAMGVLAGGEYVHTFRDGGMALIGTDWERDEVAAKLAEGRPEILGDMARRLKHGVGIIDGHGLLAFATDEKALAALEASLNDATLAPSEPNKETPLERG